MIHLTRVVKVKYSGPDDYLPENIGREKWMPVIGYEVRHVKKTIKEVERDIEEIFFRVIDNNGKLVHVAAFNCSVMIDEKATMDGNQIVSLLGNVVSLIKVLSEKVSKYPDAAPTS